ncbi:MAG: diguanylate cyclase/phosphodiesterase & domain with sensor(s) [Frankiales bacterium]|nr:diguanylate cyclase/phosphodiesterase & domain with sensor(s) [Frankiales bacterium]
MTTQATERAAERALRARQSMRVLSTSADVFETFFDHARIGLALADLSTGYVRVNQTYAELVGRPPEDLVGVSFTDVLHPDDRASELTRIEDLLSGRESSLSAEERYVDPAGQVRWVLHGVSVVRDAEGTPAWLAVSAQDITERRRVESDLRALTATLTERAVRDPLTGLANRTLLLERLRGVLARDARTGQSTAVLFLDLDGFKAVNDRFGHAVGDEVLTSVATRLAGAVRPSDTVARIGGDEFVVLVEGATEEAVEVVVERLREAVTAPLPTLDLEVGVSIGVALSERGKAEPSALLHAADQAMYRHKSRHKKGEKSVTRRARTTR